MKVTKTDIDRNLQLIEDGKPLDMPLAYLNGNLKKKAYQKSDKYKVYKKAYQKSYYQKKKNGLNLASNEGI